MGAPHVELLWWDGCASWRRAREELRQAMEEAGLDPDALELREVDTESAAERHGFVGSPTIRIAGADVQPPETPEPAGLTCRVYRRRDGRLWPTPDPEDLLDALRLATGAAEPPSRGP